jgi:hypothetical protein
MNTFVYMEVKRIDSAMNGRILGVLVMHLNVY